MQYLSTLWGRLWSSKSTAKCQVETDLRAEIAQLQQDLAQTKSNHNRLYEVQRRYERMMAKAPVFIYLVAENGIAPLHNSRILQGFSSPQHQILKRLSQMFFDVQAIFDLVRNAAPGQLPTIQLETNAGWYQVHFAANKYQNGVLRSVIAVAFNINAQKEAEADAEQYMEQLKSFLDISATLAGPPEVNKLLNLIVKSVIQCLPTAHASSLYLYDEEEGEFIQKISYGAPISSLYAPPRLSCQDHIATHILETHESCRVGNILHHANWSHLLPDDIQAGDVYSLIAMPLAFAERVMGILFAYNIERFEAFSERDEDLSLHYTVAAAAAIHSARMKDEIEAQRDQAKKLTAQIISSKERESIRIGSELHDSLGQDMYALKLQLEHLLKLNPPSTQQWQSALGLILNDLGACHQQLRTIVNDLHHSTLDDFPLPDALNTYINHFRFRTPMKIRFRAMSLPPLSYETKIVIYRCIQESLLNAHKHAQAQVVDVALDSSRDCVMATITDDGMGFEVPEVLHFPEKYPGGNGLYGMRERTHFMGGVFLVDSIVGKGTTIQVKIPFKTAYHI